jgi:hypothetical protein
MFLFLQLLQVESSHGHSASAPNSRSSSRLSDVTAVSSVSGSASPDEEVVSSKMVRMMLAQKGLQKYEAQFEKHSIRPSQLKELNEYDLIAMGVADRADRTKIARALRDSGNSGKASTDESDPDLDDSDVRKQKNEKEDFAIWFLPFVNFFLGWRML